MYRLLVFFFLLALLPWPGCSQTIARQWPDGMPDSMVQVKSITFKGNKTTRENILRRELLFAAGDTLSLSEFRNLAGLSRENLLNTSLFNFVEVDTTFSTSSPLWVQVVFRCTERWYLWPFPVIEMADRNFNTWLQNEDPSRVTYGFYFQKDNFRGQREKLKAIFKLGYNRVYGLSYEIPYLTKKQNLGLSLSSIYQKNHSVPYDSYNNKLKELKDKDFFIRTSLTTTLRLSYRKGIHHYHYLSLLHYRYEFADTLLVLNPSYSFAGNCFPEFFSLSYRYKADFRDFQPYPLQGYYLDFELVKDGLNLSGSYRPVILTLKSSARKYWKIKSRLHYAAGMTSKLSLQESQPFFLMKGLGYENDYVRGYEYYVVDGEDYFLLRNDLKYSLLDKRVYRVPYLPEAIGKLHYTVYLSMFTDFAYVRSSRMDNLNVLSDRWMIGHGVGLNIVTYYDKVFRVEISKNQRGETGMFLSFVASL